MHSLALLQKNVIYSGSAHLPALFLVCFVCVYHRICYSTVLHLNRFLTFICGTMLVCFSFFSFAAYIVCLFFSFLFVILLLYKYSFLYKNISMYIILLFCYSTVYMAVFQSTLRLSFILHTIL